jgi:signal transduction histidine kinase
LTNVARHAGASHVHLRLERKPGSVAAWIEDDGRGFEAARLVQDASERGAGLVGMRERVALLGGGLVIQSSRGEGTRLSVEIPLE